MRKIVFATYGSSPALQHARNQLESWGYAFTQDLQQATDILLPIPSGNFADQLPQLPPSATVFGGNLSGLEHKKVDLLQDTYYLIENAAITAQCALHYADIRPGTAVLVIGWGRIGKHLSVLLSQMGAQVTVAVRKTSDYCALAANDMEAVYLSDLNPMRYSVIFNTAPAELLQQTDCREDATLIDLASVKGITGDRVIWARGLPGKDAPELSGTLIAKTVLRYALGKE